MTRSTYNNKYGQAFPYKIKPFNCPLNLSTFLHISVLYLIFEFTDAIYQTKCTAFDMIINLAKTPYIYMKKLESKEEMRNKQGLK